MFGWIGKKKIIFASDWFKIHPLLETPPLRCTCLKMVVLNVNISVCLVCSSIQPADSFITSQVICLELTVSLTNIVIETIQVKLFGFYGFSFQCRKILTLYSCGFIKYCIFISACESFYIPRSLSDRASMFEFSESFNSYFVS